MSDKSKGSNTERDIEDWGREFGEKAAEFGEKAARWGEQFGEKAGKWGEELGRKMERWGDKWASDKSRKGWHFWPGAIIPILIVFVLLGMVLSFVFKILPWLVFAGLVYLGFKYISKSGWHWGNHSNRAHGDAYKLHIDKLKRKNDELDESDEDYIDLDKVYEKPKREGNVTHI